MAERITPQQARKIERAVEAVNAVLGEIGAEGALIVLHCDGGTALGVAVRRDVAVAEVIATLATAGVEHAVAWSDRLEASAQRGEAISGSLIPVDLLKNRGNPS